MAYNDSLPAVIDKVRSLLGDVNANEYLPDNTINALLVEFNQNVYLTAIEACWRIIAKIAKDVDHNAMGFGASVSQRTAHFTALAKRLRTLAGLADAGMYVGGASQAEARRLESDADYTQNRFSIGKDDR